MEKNFIKIYADFLKKFLKPAKPLKIVFDCSNGTTGEILKCLKTKKLKAVFINNNSDGNFPDHGPDPLKKNAFKNLQFAVKKYKADLGIIFDADGDRAFFIDNLGRFIDPDVVSRLLIRHLKPKKVIIDVRVGKLIRNLKSSNLKIIESKVGGYFIKKLMRKTEADFGCERSGHYYFKKFFYCDSGILTAIEVISAVSKLPYSLADFNDLSPQYYRSEEINIKYNDNLQTYANTADLLKKIEMYFKSKTTNRGLQTIKYIDGLTMEFDSPAGEWRFNLRPSNTELVFRLNIEADNKKTLIKNHQLLRQSLSEFQSPA